MPPRLSAIDLRIADWFERKGWRIFDFQREVWDAFSRGESGLIHCATGAGKTYAVWFAALREALRRTGEGGGLRVLWVTPLRALAADTEGALAAPLEALLPDWRVARRTGDTSSHARRKIAENPPQALVTTPESLSLLLSQPDFLRHFQSLELVVVDEWHELISTKRGVLMELALARLRTLAPAHRVWGLSATLGNTEEAAKVLGGFHTESVPRAMRIVAGGPSREVQIETLLPPEDDRYPWGGHLGLQLLPKVLPLLKKHSSSIIFTNTRSQAELWHQALREALPEWEGRIGLHHGSLDGDVRGEAEEGLRTGRFRTVVATASLDLGVDFAPVDAVLQIGSPKGVARLLQRAGRSGHRPGAKSTIYCVPANTFELVEISAVRDLVAANQIEERSPLSKPLDVLCQHLATVASGGWRSGETGFSAEALKSEVRQTHAYRTLTEGEWDWALHFAARGGEALLSYPQYARMVESDGVYAIKNAEMARHHRMNIGTITSDASMSVQFLGGRRLGTVEESFLSRLKPGQRFIFAGRSLELIRIRDLRAYVKPAKNSRGVPRWMGGRMPLSTQMSFGVRARLDAAHHGVLDTPEMERLRDILQIQAARSRIPQAQELLVEQLHSREGYHTFFYPFEGRLVHEGLAALFAFRLGRIEPQSFSIAVNDYGFELLSATRTDLEAAFAGGLFSDENLLDDVLGSINSHELARRRFREIARVAGLTSEGVGQSRKTVRQLQVSAGLLYDVFRRYDPDNRLLRQATDEVLENQLEHTRLRAALAQMRSRSLCLVEIETVSPFSYPLFVERFREQLSTETLAQRVRKMELVLEGESSVRKTRKYLLNAVGT